MSRRRVALALAAAYAAVAIAVAAGGFTGLDQWAVTHAMPGLAPPQPPPTTAEGVVPLLHAHWSSAWDDVTNLVTLPGQVLLSLAIVLALRRARYVAAWLAGTAVEVICKELLVRPALYRGGAHLAAFDSSYPSGHTLRIAIVAAALAAAAPRLRPPMAVWAAGSILLLEPAGWHTPSDILGGLLLAGFLLALLRRPARRAAR